MRFSAKVSKVSAVALFSATVLLLSACSGPPAPGPVPSSSATLSDGAVPSPVFTPSAEDLIPPNCEDVYTPTILAELNSQIPPLNDPNVTFGPIDNAEAADIQFDTGVQLRCNWGTPSERGIVTEFMALDQSQTDAVITALLADGYERIDDQGAVMLLKSETFGEPGNLQGAGHRASYFRDGVWFASYQLNIEIADYNEQIISAIWPD